MQLFLIRHPRPLHGAGLCYGQLDLAAEDPAPVARRLRPLLPADAVLCASPLLRCRRLAEALHAQPQFDQRLMEINFGEWEGQAWDAVERRLLDLWAADPLHFTPPGGESAACLQARAVGAVAEMRAARSIVVSHAGVIRALLGHYLGLAIDEWSVLPIDFGSLSLLEIEPARQTGVLRYLNR
ncbi:alpha-ribazole phosphatase family protein [Accumulibacter sp.]|uniref:alpha-ribazole phosphatase family protein n=1 Tax=Accumulibacter sp. TaxID=2053492 RepID=UPI00262A60BA|nr:alpha-ribazole phosphatase family protein [Accumulibacter sp.]